MIAVYRQATDLMTLELLPPAYNLTLEGGATVREAYAAKRSAVLSGRIWVALAGLAVITALAALQVFVAAHFRRRLNPALAVATLGLIFSPYRQSACCPARLRTCKPPRPAGSIRS